MAQAYCLVCLKQQRATQWAVMLAIYEDNLQFRKSSAHGNANALSRLPLPESVPDLPEIVP